MINNTEYQPVPQQAPVVLLYTAPYWFSPLVNSLWDHNGGQASPQLEDNPKPS